MTTPSPSTTDTLSAKTLPTHSRVMLIKDVIVKDEALACHDAFNTWLEKYGEYII